MSPTDVAAVRERGDQSLLQRSVPILHFDGLDGSATPDAAHVFLGVDPFAISVKKTVLSRPVDVLFQDIHSIVDVQHVVEDATREKHVADPLLRVVEDG